MVQAGSAPRRQMATVIQNDLAQIGIGLSIVPLDSGALQRSSLRHARDYDAVFPGVASGERGSNTDINIGCPVGRSTSDPRGAPRDAVGGGFDSLMRQAGRRCRAGTQMFHRVAARTLLAEHAADFRATRHPGRGQSDAGQLHARHSSALCSLERRRAVLAGRRPEADGAADSKRLRARGMGRHGSCRRAAMATRSVGGADPSLSSPIFLDPHRDPGQRADAAASSRRSASSCTPSLPNCGASRAFARGSSRRRHTRPFTGAAPCRSGRRAQSLAEDEAESWQPIRPTSWKSPNANTLRTRSTRCRRGVVEMIRLLFFSHPPIPYADVAEVPRPGHRVNGELIRGRCLKKLQRALDNIEK